MNNLKGEFIRVEKAKRYFLCFDNHDEDREMIEKLSDARREDNRQLCSNVEGVIVIDNLSDSLTIEDFFSIID